MSEHLETVKGHLLDLGLTITGENEVDDLVVVDDEDNGIKQLVIDCEPPIVILEQLIGDVPPEPGDLFTRLLQMNNTLVHGAFALDETDGRIFYRDTLQTAVGKTAQVYMAIPARDAGHGQVQMTVSGQLTTLDDAASDGSAPSSVDVRDDVVPHRRGDAGGR